jgi:hypothetical protein
MKTVSLSFLILCGSLAYAKDVKPQFSGTLLQMDSVECGAEQKSAKNFAGDMLGTDSAPQRTRVLLCQEYILQTDRMTYRIRPRDDRHRTLLPVSTKAQFRLDRDKMKLRMEDLDDKEREYLVVSMTPREVGANGGAR